MASSDLITLYFPYTVNKKIFEETRIKSYGRRSNPVHCMKAEAYTVSTVG